MSRKFSFTALLALHLIALLAGFLAPNSATKQHRDLPWAPPTKIRYLDSQGQFHLRPFVYRLVPHPTNPTLYQEDKTRRYPLRLLQRGDTYRLAGLIPANHRLLGVEPPATLFYLGTDGVGRDLFARTLAGGRVSLFAGLLAAALALFLGLLLGGTAGYLGGRADTVLMATAELFLTLPWLYLILAIRAFLPLTPDPLASFLLIVTILGLIGWARPSRLFRGVLLSERESLFVMAARGAGASHSRVLVSHLLPQLLAVLRTQFALLIPTYILAEVALSFLGLGVTQPLISWGSLLADLQKYHILQRHPTMLAPAALLILAALCYYYLPDRWPRHKQDGHDAT